MHRSSSVDITPSAAGRTASRALTQQILINSRQFLASLLNHENAVAALVLSPRVFRFVWVLVVGAHLLSTAFLAGLAATYSYLTDPIMVYYVQLWAPSRENENYRLYAVLFALTALLHALRVLQLICRSIRERRLVFRRVKTRTSSNKWGNERLKPAGPIFLNGTSNVPERPTMVSQLAQNRRTRYQFLVGYLGLGWRALFSRTGLFGVEGQHFHAIFIVREVIELATQTYQAYRSSHLLPRVWLNDILVAMFVANCWSTLAAQHFIRHQPALERVVALCADAFICITMVIVVPAVLVGPYVSAFDIPNHRFGPSVSFYDPSFMAKCVLEAQLVFVSSFSDFLAKLLPHFAIYLTLGNISGLVTRLQNSVSADTTTSIMVISTKTTHQLRSESATKDKTSERRSAVWTHRVVKTAFCLWGIVILTVHLHAKVVSQSTEVYGCRASTRPWLKRRLSCSYLVVNCKKHDKDTADSSFFNQTDMSVLTTLTLAHCPKLVMPESFPRFSNLMILHVYNSSVTSWGSFETMTSNPRLTSLIVAQSQVSPLAAQGLVMPISLSTVQFCGTNLELIPELLPWSIHPMAVLAFDYNELKSIPASLMAMQTYAISLKGNKLETVPQLAEMPPNQMVYGLELSDNPLRELPDTLASPMNFFIRLDLQSTNISALPSWTLTQVLGVIYMYETPYCTSTLPELLQRNVICFPRPATYPGMQVPFDLFKAMYAYELD